MALELCVLGCGSATPTTRFNPTAQLLEIRNHYFLIDCGENTQVELRRRRLRFSKINHIFISHLHGDHYFGLIGLLSSFHLLDRTQPLHIHGPADLQEIIALQLRVSQTKLRFPLHFHHTQDNGPAVVFEDDKVVVTSFPLKHSIATTGFLFQEKLADRKINSDNVRAFQVPIYALNGLKKGRDYEDEQGNIIPNAELTLPPPPPLSYAFCSDTAYSEKNTELLAGVNLLYHESTFLEVDQALAKKTKHSTSTDAARFAKKINAQHLLIGHYSVRYDDLQLFEKEAKTIFENTKSARDGHTYHLDNNKQLTVKVPTR
jgi:ribonuclease Z